MLQSHQVLQERYQLHYQLGYNPGRQTWLATDVQTQTSVVVKLLISSNQVKWDQLRLFKREAQVLKHLNHPKIPCYCDFFCLDDHLIWFALVQSYISGPTLKQLLAQGKQFDEAEVRQIAMQLLELLIYLHGLSPPVLHRDIKPSNVVVHEDGRLYLIDFGSVQDRAAQEGSTFTIVGTYGYTPLEQLGGRATPASDLYALGATLIHLLTAVSPADLPVVNGRLQFTQTLNLNPGFVRWLWRLTEVNQELRFASAREALRALQQNEAMLAHLVPCPPSTQIQLHKSPHQLEFTIQSKRFHWLTFKTYVKFDCQQFEICWSWWGMNRRKRGLITDIEQVTSGELQGSSKDYLAVKIMVGVDEYLISSILLPLTLAERDWLLQEIKQWLGLE